MNLKKLSIAYQNGAPYPAEVKKLEDAHIESIMNKIKVYSICNDISLKDTISIFRGLWQAKHGFVRELDKKIKK